MEDVNLEANEQEQNDNEDGMTMEGLARGIARMLEESEAIDEQDENSVEDETSLGLDESNSVEQEADIDNFEEPVDESQESCDETEVEKLDVLPIVESILFVNEKAISASEIAKPLELERSEVEDALKRLMEIYDGRAGGLRIFKVSGGYQMRTSSETVDWVKKLYRNKFKRRLSNSALEVLSIVAYKQPITKMELEAIRGVDCDGVIRSLSNMGLVKIKGRKDVIGRPFLYGTSDMFLEHFGLNSLRDMPKIDFEEAALALSQLEQKDDDTQENAASFEQEDGMQREAIDVEASDVEPVVAEVQEEQKDGS